MSQGMPPRQQGKGQGFAVAVADTQFSQGAHPGAAAAALQFFHQQTIAAATARHQELLDRWPLGEILANHGGGEGREGGQGMGRVGLLIGLLGPGLHCCQALGEVGAAKQFPAG